MLLQETITISTPEPIVGGRLVPPPTVLEETAELNSTSRSAERSSQETVSAELLAQVQELRLHSDQKMVMTKQKRIHKDRTAWVFLGGMVAAGAISLFLVYTNYVTYLKYMEMSADVRAQNETIAKQLANRVPVTELAKQWSFPGAQQHSSSISNSAASLRMTSKESYLSVWQYYAQKAGFKGVPERLPSPFLKDGSIPNLPNELNTMEGTQPVRYQMGSHGSNEHPVMLFTRHAGPSVVNIMVTPGIGKNTVDISIDAMDGE